MATKKHLISALTKKLHYLNNEDAKLCVDSIIESIKESLINKERVELRGFGSFSVRPRKYPEKDEEYNSVYFRMSDRIQKKINDLD